MIHGIGIEIIEVQRFRKALERWGERIERRLFTSEELRYCSGQRFPERHLAARFAAKVSLFKALGRTLPFRDVEVTRDEKGRPSVTAKGASAAGLRFAISLSHDGELAVAETVAERVA